MNYTRTLATMVYDGPRTNPLEYFFITHVPVFCTPVHVDLHMLLYANIPDAPKGLS